MTPDGRSSEQALRTRRSGWSAAAIAFLALVQVDLALVRTFPEGQRIASGVAAVVLGAMVPVVLSRRVVLRTGPSGVEVCRLVGRPRRVERGRLGEAVVRGGAPRRVLELRGARRRRPVVVAHESRLSGSVDEMIAALASAGIPVRLERARHLQRLRVPPLAYRAVGGAACAALAVNAPVPSLYAAMPGTVASATAAVIVSGDQAKPGAGDIHLVTVGLGPASLLTVLSAGDDSAVDVGSAPEILGDAPSAVAAEAERQMTRTAAREAVAAAWRWMGVDVAVDGAGMEVMVVPGSLRSQLRPEDVVVAVDAKRTPSRWAFWAALGDRPADDVVLTVRRGHRQFQVVAQAGWLRETPRLFVAPAEVRLVGAPLDVEVEHPSLRGPSAGLAWGLAVIARVNEVDLASGRTVVAPGELTADGVVHPVGSIPQKVEAAAGAGADVLLVAAEQAPLARAHAGQRMQVIGVDTLADAVEWLRRS